MKERPVHDRRLVRRSDQPQSAETDLVVRVAEREKSSEVEVETIGTIDGLGQRDYRQGREDRRRDPLRTLFRDRR